MADSAVEELVRQLWRTVAEEEAKFYQFRERIDASDMAYEERASRVNERFREMQMVLRPVRKALDAAIANLAYLRAMQPLPMFLMDGEGVVIERDKGD